MVMIPAVLRKLCPCAPLPMCLIPHVPHHPCPHLDLCIIMTMCPIAHVPLITYVPHHPEPYLDLTLLSNVHAVDTCHMYTLTLTLTPSPVIG